MKSYIEFITKNINDDKFYHGTGEVEKVKESLKNNTFKPFVSAGVIMGIFVTPDKKLATNYSNESKGSDKGVITFTLNRPVKLKYFKSAEELYEYECSFDKFNMNNSTTLFKEQLLSEDYDGYQSGDTVILIFQEKMEILTILS